MITRYLSLILLLIVLLAAPSTLIAQTTSQPIIILGNGDLWVWDNGLTPLTQTGNVIGAVISPDGTHIAYNILSPVTVDALERVGGWNGYRPDNIHIIGVDGSDRRVVGDQPSDAVLFADDGSPNNAWVRSLPTWSPDGAQLAWTEYNIGQISENSGRLIIYNLNSAQAQTGATSLPDMQAAGPPPIDVHWGNTSLALWLWNYMDEDNNLASAFWIYDPDYGASLEPISDEQSRKLNDIAWVHTEQALRLGLFYKDGTHDLMGPNGEIVAVYPASPALISGHALHNSVALTYKINPNAEFRERTIWTATYPDGDTYTLPYRGSDLTISPDGEAVAYVEDETLTIWSRDTTTTHPIDLPWIDTVMWGATTWRDGAPTYDCAAMPPTRLTVGAQARVIPGTSPNNMRATFPSGDVLTQLPPGDVFTVTAGPVCMAGYHWWQVDYQGTIGWTAEGGSGKYWIEPVP